MLKSPPDGNQMLLNSHEEAYDFIKVKLFLYTESKALREKIFPDEWYTVMKSVYDEDQGQTINRDMQPWIEVIFSHLLTSNLQGLVESY